jgi:DUF1365 family protein
MLGYLFNPVSFYFCSDQYGAPIASIAEVTNTFRETKLYLLGRDTLQSSKPLGPSSDGGSERSATFRLKTPKFFYVSPFSDVDVAFDFKLTVPGDHLRIQIDDVANGVRTFTSSVTGVKRPLTGPRLAWYLFKYPFLTLRVILLIHWHALLLWTKRVGWFAKAARPLDQRNLYRPHPSLRPASTGNMTPSPDHIVVARA